MEESCWENVPTRNDGASGTGSQDDCTNGLPHKQRWPPTSHCNTWRLAVDKQTHYRSSGRVFAPGWQLSLPIIGLYIMLILFQIFGVLIMYCVLFLMTSFLWIFNGKLFYLYFWFWFWFSCLYIVNRDVLKVKTWTGVYQSMLILIIRTKSFIGFFNFNIGR